MGRTIIIERHDWETSGSGHQVQIPMDAYADFWHDFTGERTVRVFDPPNAAAPARTADALFRHYERSATNRINGVLELGDIGPGCIMIEEFVADDSSISYDLWWFEQPDADKIFARAYGWNQAKDSQHGPGRRWTILPGSGPRTV